MDWLQCGFSYLYQLNICLSQSMHCLVVWLHLHCYVFHGHVRPLWGSAFMSLGRRQVDEGRRRFSASELEKGNVKWKEKTPNHAWVGTYHLSPRRSTLKPLPEHIIAGEVPTYTLIYMSCSATQSCNNIRVHFPNTRREEMKLFLPCFSHPSILPL